MMKLRRSLLSTGLALSVLGWAGAATLQEQLDLARGDEDALAQIEIIQRILPTEPGNRELRERLVALWLEVGDYDQAEKNVQDETSVAPDLRARVLARVMYVRDGRKDEAIALLSEAHGKMPDDLATTRLLAEYLGEAGRWPEVVALLDQAPGVGNDVSLLLIRADARRRGADFGQAWADFEQAARLADSNDRRVVERRPEYERLQVASQQIHEASAKLAQDPRALAALLARAYWYLYTGFAPDQAVTDAGVALEVEPDFPVTRIVNTYARHAAGRLTPDERIKSGVDPAQPLPEWALLERTLRDDTALKAKPRDVKLLSSRAALLTDMRQYRLAEADWDAVVALSPKDDTARLAKVSLAAQRQDFDAAAEAFRLMAGGKVPPARVAAAASLVAQTAFENSRYDIALDFINRAIKLQPTPSYHTQRAAILQRLDRGAEAEADLALARTMSKKTSR